MTLNHHTSRIIKFHYVELFVETKISENNPFNLYISIWEQTLFVKYSYLSLFNFEYVAGVQYLYILAVILFSWKSQIGDHSINEVWHEGVKRYYQRNSMQSIDQNYWPYWDNLVQTNKNTIIINRRLTKNWTSQILVARGDYKSFNFFFLKKWFNINILSLWEVRTIPITLL